MIISHKYKFIFIKTAKTAGTSIELKLNPLCDKNDVFTFIGAPNNDPEMGYAGRNYRGWFNPIPELLTHNSLGWYRTLAGFYHRLKFGSHYRAAVIRSRLPSNIWNNYFKFCVDRNPFDKCVSMYRMNSNHWSAKDFERWVDRGIYPHGLHYYTDKLGNLLIDRVIRYEQLDTELPEVLRHVGIEIKSLDVFARSKYRAPGEDYRSYYSARSRQIIENAFKKELEFNHYQF